MGKRLVEVESGACFRFDDRMAQTGMVSSGVHEDSAAVCRSSLLCMGTKRSISFSSDRSKGENWTCNAHVTSVDPSAVQTLSAETRTRADKELEAGGTTATDGGKVVIDFAELVMAWRCGTLGDGDVKLVATAIMRGLKRC
jgi:hypothetical protein